MDRRTDGRMEWRQYPSALMAPKGKNNHPLLSSKMLSTNIIVNHCQLPLSSITIIMSNICISLAQWPNRRCLKCPCCLGYIFLCNRLLSATHHHLVLGRVSRIQSQGWRRRAADDLSDIGNTHLRGSSDPPRLGTHRQKCSRYETWGKDYYEVNIKTPFYEQV